MLRKRPRSRPGTALPSATIVMWEKRGIGLALAITQLVAIAGDARVFRYQGF